MADDKDNVDVDSQEAKPTKREWPHVVSLHNSDPGHNIGLQKEIGIFRRNLPDMIEFYNYESKLVRSRYLALIKEGFTEDQALKLCRG